MKFKFAALAGCSLASLLTSGPAMALEASEETIATGTRVQDIEFAVSDDELAFLTPITLEAEASDVAMALPALYASVLASSAPLGETLPEPTPAIDRTTTLRQRVSLDEPTSASTGQNADHEAGWISELRFGLLAQDRGPITNDVEFGAAVNVEVLFRSPDVLSSIGAPRPHIGISAATDSDSTSYLYGGLTWEHDFQEHWFLVGGLGLAIHNGETLRKSDLPPEEWGRVKTLGCRVDFHWGIGAGRRLSDEWNVALHYEHVSSGDVCIKGALGLENVGIRIGRVF